MIKKQAFLFLFLLGLGSVSLAQEAPRMFGTQTVIAPSGLNLRKGMGLTAGKIGRIPFGAAVELLSEVSQQQDTVDYTYSQSPATGVVREPVYGGWVKVRYQALEGYVFAGLLGDFNLEAVSQPEMIIRYEGFSCESLQFDPRAYHWYGIFILEGKQEIRSIRPTIYSSGEMIPFLTFVTGEQEPTLMIIGSVQPLNNRILSPEEGGELPIQLGRFQGRPPSYQHSRFQLNWDPDTVWGENAFQLMLQANGQRRRVLFSEAEEPFIMYPYVFADLIWYGDLNQDGRLDFVFRAGMEYPTTVLYMGDAARGIRQAALYFTGPCC